jgi:transcription elongation GreA/GreB family factor
VLAKDATTKADIYEQRKAAKKEVASLKLKVSPMEAEERRLLNELNALMSEKDALERSRKKLNEPNERVVSVSEDRGEGTEVINLREAINYRVNEVRQLELRLAEVEMDLKRIRVKLDPARSQLKAAIKKRDRFPPQTILEDRREIQEAIEEIEQKLAMLQGGPPEELMALESERSRNLERIDKLKPPVMTAAGRVALLGEIEALEIQLAEVSRLMADAAAETANGWHDNASYEVAQAEQKRINQRMDEIRWTIKNSDFVDPSIANHEVVSVGSLVTLSYAPDEDEDDDLEIVHVLGFGESSVTSGKGMTVVSANSPLAAAILGARTGDIRGFNAGGSEIKVRVKAISSPTSVLEGAQ